MYYSEGYRPVIRWISSDGWPVMRPVEDVFLPEWNEVDKTIRPVVDSSPGNIHRMIWKTDSYYRQKLDSLPLDVVY